MTGKTRPQKGFSSAAGHTPSRSGSARRDALFLPCSDRAQHLFFLVRTIVLPTTDWYSKTKVKTIQIPGVSKGSFARSPGVFEYSRCPGSSQAT